MDDRVEGLIRLAWYMDNEGKPGARDALLTLVAAEGVRDDASLCERCRRLLSGRHPGHWYARGASVREALARPRTAVAVAKLQTMFPPVRVQRLLLRSEVRRGPYTGRITPLARVVADLGLTPERPETLPLDDGSGLHALPFALPFPAGRPGEDGVDRPLVELYLSVLVALTILLQGLAPGAADSRAA
jgi:hypothetical protein